MSQRELRSDGAATSAESESPAEPVSMSADEPSADSVSSEPVSDADEAIEEFNLDDIELIESKVFGY